MRKGGEVRQGGGGGGKCGESDANCATWHFKCSLHKFSLPTPCYTQSWHDAKTIGWPKQ